MDATTAINQWIIENQALAVTIGVPAFTVLVGFLTSYLSHKSKKDEIRLAGREKLADLRKESYSQLVNEIALLQGRVVRRLTEQTISKNTKGITEIKLLELVECANNISVRLHSDNQLNDKFLEVFSDCLSQLTEAEEESEEREKGPNSIPRLRDVCREILAAEWRTIENELKNLE